MKPYLECILPESEKRLNNRLSRARITINRLSVGLSLDGSY